ncbi:MAG: KAP family NTPase [Paracoccaceae bacterium]|nr:KAP family NTPase [Paracoccaceae bacterium]
MGTEATDDPWHRDRLGYRNLGETYSNLIRSIDDSKVISIEAGFGRGKTFFRKAWAQHLRGLGEAVIEIEAQQSDHSGDPVVTFLGALVGALHKDKKPKAKKAVDAGKKYAALATKAVAKALLREGAEELIDGVTGRALDQVEGFEVLERTVEELGEGMSKLAGTLIATQLAAEKVRTQEMPEQLRALREALTEYSDSERVVILIDELDRCHPEYAIALLEAMKLVFDQPGYVFCLMVNAEYQENLAAHRFGRVQDGERYLDKFVDIRRGLPVTSEALSTAAMELAETLPLVTPYGDNEEFGVGRAAKVASDLAPSSGLSMRQIEKALLKVELALRCYSYTPLDCPLLVYLSFQRTVEGSQTSAPKEVRFSEVDVLVRSALSPKKAADLCEAILQDEQSERLRERQGRARYEAEKFANSFCRELTELPDERYKGIDRPNYFPWYKVLRFLAPDYLPSHERVLDVVESMQADAGRPRPSGA